MVTQQRQAVGAIKWTRPVRLRPNPELADAHPGERWRSTKESRATGSVDGTNDLPKTRR
jgi:hypothetical protein